MPILDIFNNDAFSPTTMALAIDRMPFKPNFLGSSGIFTRTPIRTESIVIEERDGTLDLIKTSNRGESLTRMAHRKFSGRSYRTTRIGRTATIRASELAFTRSFGEADQVKLLQGEILDRLGGAGASSVGLIDQIDYTLEHLRLGAIQGKVLDADGSVIVDWLQEFDAVTTGLQSDDVFDFSAMSQGDFRHALKNIYRATKRNAKGAWTAGTQIHCLCGSDAWDEMLKLAEIYKLFENRIERANYVDNADPYDSFTFANITFHEYEGSDDGAVSIATDEFRFYPVNAPSAFLEVFSHGEQFDHIDQLGQEIYPMIIPDHVRNESVDLEVRSYPLHICTRPAMLKKCTLA